MVGTLLASKFSLPVKGVWDGFFSVWLAFADVDSLSTEALEGRESFFFSILALDLGVVFKLFRIDFGFRPKLNDCVAGRILGRD